MFVYDAVLEALKFGDTSVPCIELRQKYAKLLAVNPESGKTFCQEEYEVGHSLAVRIAFGSHFLLEVIKWIIKS